jgi:hypothetical protein
MHSYCLLYAGGSGDGATFGANAGMLRLRFIILNVYQSSDSAKCLFHILTVYVNNISNERIIQGSSWSW